MKEKDLKKLNRYQLLELLIAQTERADQLQARLEEAEQKLNDKELRIKSLGSIAEAALELNGVFQAAQTAADQYLNAAKKRAKAIEDIAKRKADALLAKAGEKAQNSNEE